MEEGCVQIVAMAESNSDSEEKYEVYEAGSNMFCFISSLDNKQTNIKATGAKTRYKQSYREAWESMRDFKGWLTSVPGNTSKAYCKLCQKELHCHRLSLLKHKVTFKHQKKEEEQKSGGKLKNCEYSDLRSGKNDSIIVDVDEDDDEEDDYEEENEEENSVGLKVVGNDLEESVAASNTCKSVKCKDGVKGSEGTMTSTGGPLSTHVLDLNKGLPAPGIHVVLYKLIDGRWTLIQEGLTNSNGRYDQFLLNASDFTVGRYKLHFDVDKYFAEQNQETIFPFIEIAFDVKDNSSHYHIPLLLSPFGYSTYRGS